MRRRVDGLVVAVPAHDEADTLPHALRALRAAERHARARLRDVPPLTLVVTADACTDATEAVARTAGAEVVRTGHRSAGAARAAAVAHGLRRAGTPAAHTWIATTDADSRVPVAWIAHQLTCARDGWDCVLGTVRLAPARSLEEAVVRDLHRTHYFAGRPAGSGPDWEHPHVHGANFGVVADVYARAGGFPPVPLGEDRALARALGDGGARVLRTNACAVETSGRLTPRAPYGFGAFLRTLRAGAASGGASAARGEGGLHEPLAVTRTTDPEVEHSKVGVIMAADEKTQAKVEQTKGKVKETAGRTVGNERMTAEGRADQAKGDARQAKEKTKDAFKH